MAPVPASKRHPAKSLYERDVYAWAQEQARLLKEGRFDEVDAANVAEEILDVGRNEYDKLQSALRVLLMHMLKWDHQPEKRTRSWILTILEQRDRVEQQLEENPSLRSRLADATARGYRAGRLRAAGEIDMDLSAFPEHCPYDWQAIMNRQFQL